MKKIFLKIGIISISLILVGILTLLSCDGNRIYESHIDPSGHLEWNRGDTLVFDIEIIDTSIKYNQFIDFRHAVGYAFSACSLDIIETDPNGEVVQYGVVLEVADTKSYKGECMGDICDLETTWLENRTFTIPGTYQYKVSHRMTDDLLHMVMEVGMMLDESAN